MFLLSLIEEEVRVSPRDLCKTPLEAVTEVLEQRFLDRVVPSLGLVVTLYDVQSLEGGFVYPNDGAAFFKVRFRAVVFRPFVGEVILGRLASSTKAGARVSLDFFHDVLIPEHALQDPSFFNEAEQLWVWKFDGNDMFMDLGEPVRFKVRCVRFNTPPTPLQQASANDEEKLLGTPARPFAPMEVIGDMNGDGLGLLSWWGGGEEEGEQEAAAE